MNSGTLVTVIHMEETDNGEKSRSLMNMQLN